MKPQGKKFPEGLSRGASVEVGGVGESGNIHKKFFVDHHLQGWHLHVSHLSVRFVAEVWA